MKLSRVRFRDSIYFLNQEFRTVDAATGVDIEVNLNTGIITLRPTSGVAECISHVSNLVCGLVIPPEPAPFGAPKKPAAKKPAKDPQ